MTLLLAPDPDGMVRAASLLSAGQLVGFPTETVYGLGGDARSDAAVAAIFTAKGRPSFNPLIVHVPDLAAARQLAFFPPEAERLAQAFWPGPLTLVVQLRPDAGLSTQATAGLGTVGLRAPAHPVAQALLAAFGGPIAAPSANPSGRISPTRADHVMESLGGRIAAVVDAGPSAVGVESTIVIFDPEVAILRHGGIPGEEIEACLGRPVPGAVTRSDRPSAPGQLDSHYAPRAALRMEADQPRSQEVWIGFGPQSAGAPISLSPTGNLAEAASTLFIALREADRLAGPTGVIAVAPIPDHGLGRAINDRLRRAAAPRR